MRGLVMLARMGVLTLVALVAAGRGDLTSLA